MTANLPPALLKFFTPRPPLPYVESCCRDYQERQLKRLSGLAEWMQMLSSQPAHEDKYMHTFTAEETRQLKKAAEIEASRKSLDRQIDEYSPSALAKTTDPYKTIFIGRLPPSACTEERIRSLFERFGEISSVQLVKKPNGNIRPYAFVEFVAEHSVKTCIRECDGMKVDGNRIVVDTERARSVPGWRPNRLRQHRKRTAAVTTQHEVRKRSRSPPRLRQDSGRWRSEGSAARSHFQY